MNSFSQIKKSKKVKFFELIDSKVSWDYLLGIFLSIYRKDMFIKKLNQINQKKLSEKGVWSTFENTAFYTMVYASAFKKSLAYLQSEPLVVTLHGHKNWGNLYPFIKIIRIPEVIEVYRKNGLNFIQYFREKNFALKDFIPCIFQIYKGGAKAGSKYINFFKHILLNILYPNIYLNAFNLTLNKLKNFFFK
jgi:hypothetical protein